MIVPELSEQSKAYLVGCHKNAQRLLSDSTCLFDNQRYATSYFIAMLAGEEVGKIMIETWKQAGASKKWLSADNHIHKQFAMCAIFNARSYVEALQQYGGNHGVIWVKGKDTEFLAEMTALVAKVDQKEMQIELGVLAKAAAEKDPRSGMQLLSLLGWYQGSKEAAVYHDSDVFADRDPETFTNEEAKFLIDAVQSALEFASDAAIAGATFHLVESQMNNKELQEAIKKRRLDLKAKKGVS